MSKHNRDRRQHKSNKPSEPSTRLPESKTVPPTPDLAKVKALAQQCWDHYQGRKLTGDQAACEPEWTHPAYQGIRDWIDRPEQFDDDETADIADLILGISDHTLRQEESWPFPPRLVHEGWKVGTPTWVFLGRAAGHVERYDDDLVLCCRTIPADCRNHLKSIDNCWDCWIAYSLTEPMGSSAMTANCYGPCLSKDDLIEAIEQEAKWGE